MLSTTFDLFICFYLFQLKQITGRTDRQVDGRSDERTDAQMDRRVDGWMGEWMDGWMYSQVLEIVIIMQVFKARSWLQIYFLFF